MEKEMKVEDTCACNAEPRQGQKLDYEQLSAAANQLSQQAQHYYNEAQKLAKQLEAAEMGNFFKRLDYLWNIIHSNSLYLTAEFKTQAGNEFMAMMAKPEEPEESPAQGTKVSKETVEAVCHSI